MFSFSAHRKSIIKLIIAAIITTLSACNDNSQNNDAYIQVKIAGNNTQSKTQQNTPAYAQDTTVNVLPNGITRVDFIITDSENFQTKTSLNVGSQTQTISLRVVANRNLSIVIEALTGSTVSFRGQSNVGALRPGQSFPLKVSLDAIDPPVNLPVTLSVSQTKTSQLEGDNGTANITFNVSLSSLANGNVTADYSTTDITAILGSDYATTDTVLTIPAGQLSTTISVLVSGDTIKEEDETFVLTLSNASANVTLGNSSAIGTIVSDDYPGRLNDTGANLCGDYSLDLVINSTTPNNNDFNCNTAGTSQTEQGFDTENDPVPGGQDALYGRDVNTNDDSDGLAGFSYTKLDDKGVPLADQTQDYTTQPWACVKDNFTGLIWEVKAPSASQTLQSSIYTYTWLNTTGANDGGNSGAAGAGLGCSNQGTGCNTEAFVNDVNQLNICGASNWRLPSAPELLSLVNSGQIDPVIDINYFPNTDINIYWTSTPSASTLDPGLAAWGIDFLNGASVSPNKSSGNAIRLVHKIITPR